KKREAINHQWTRMDSNEEAFALPSFVSIRVHSWFNSFAVGASQHSLHKDHIQPPVKLIADLFHVGADDEAELFVQPDAGGLLGVDAGDEGVMPQRPRAGDQVRQQRRTAP